MSSRLLTACGLLLCLVFSACSNSVAEYTPPVAARPTTVPSETPRNVILFISDGCGPASFTLARDYLRYKEGREALALDAIQVGSVRTFATDSRVTDSAASATAYACGIKTYNGAIAVDEDRQAVATVLEAAEQRGMATGLVATSRITHATPAAFSAHVPSRNMETEIAVQQMAQNVDVLLGGGWGPFVPQDQDGWREDGRHLLDEAAAAGYTVLQDRAAFDAVMTAPVVGLFTRDHMAYEIDRDAAAEPSLAEMTQKAIDLLKGNAEGFFLMVEGSRIDHAAHGNDLAAHLHDILAFDDAVAAALAFAEADGQTLILSTSDHETGGLTIGREVDGRSLYTWEPDVVDQITASHGAIAAAINAQGESAGLEPISADNMSVYAPIVAETIEAHTGIEISADEQALLASSTPQAANFVLAEIIARRAVIGWTTGGHTGVDVNVYAYGPGRELFLGNQDNAAIGQHIATLLNFDLQALTATLSAVPAGSE